MERTGYRNRGKYFGSLLAGLSLASLGTLQFFKGYFGIPWSELWPLFLIVPGIAVVVGTLSNSGRRYASTHHRGE